MGEPDQIPFEFLKMTKHPNTRTFSEEQNEKIVQLLNELLTVHGYTQVKLAEELGISQSTISNIRARKQTAGLHTALAVTKLAGVDLNDLLGVEPVELRNQPVTSVDVAKLLARSEGFDADWLDAWTCDVDNELTANQVWTLLQADYMRRKLGKPSQNVADVLKTVSQLAGIVQSLEARLAEKEASVRAPRRR